MADFVLAMFTLRRLLECWLAVQRTFSLASTQGSGRRALLGLSLSSVALSSGET